MKKLNEEDVIKHFESYGYKVLSKYERYCDPIEIEKDGYKGILSYSHLLEGNAPVLFGKRCPYQKENIIRYLKLNAQNIEFIDVKTYKKSGKTRNVITMKCKCGNIFEKTWEHIYSGDNHILCSKCAMEKGYKTRKKSNDKKYFHNILKRGYTLIDKKQHLYTNTYVEVIQNSTGYRGFIYPNTKKEMLVFSLFNNKKNYIYNMNTYAKNNGINSIAIKFNPEGKWGNKTILFKCGCGKYFETNERGITQKKTMCDKCSNSSSSYEKLIKDFLEKNKINFFKEFNFNSCKDIYPLPFDFYLKDYKCLIECDGEQHFYPVRFGSMTEEEAKIAFINTQKRDNIKNEYCKKYNIPLLRINYKEMKSDKYKQKILNFIQTVQE